MGLFSSGAGYLGIDIGTSSIKIVELGKEGVGMKLLNYGFSEGGDSGDGGHGLSVKKTAEVINKIWSEAGMKSRSAVAALPTYSVFSSVINLPNVSEKDLASAINWEAKKVIPLPLEEMVLDWKKIEVDGKGKDDVGKNKKILLTGAPQSLVKKYIEIFKEAKINLLSLETETFSLIRSLLGNDKSTVMIVEVGANTTDIAIVEKGIPTLSRSVDVGGSTITKDISNNLNISFERAEQFKYDLGVGGGDSANNVVPKTIMESISPIVNEIKYSLNLFQNKSDSAVEKIILSGGSSLLMSFNDYLSRVVDKKVIIGNPWFRISYPLDLESLLDEIGPGMSVAVGLAMREIE